MYLLWYVPNSLYLYAFPAHSHFNMESSDHDGAKSFPIGETPQETGLPYVPKCYEISSSDKPSLTPEIADVVVVDLAGLNDPTRRPIIVKDVGKACRENGFFQVRFFV